MTFGFYVLGFFYVFLDLLVHTEEQVTDQYVAESLTIALAWPIMAVGEVWVYRDTIAQVIVRYLGIETDIEETLRLEDEFSLEREIRDDYDNN